VAVTRGISNGQARRLALLRRKLGERYDGYGLTFDQAQAAIADAKRRLALKRAKPARRFRRPEERGM